MLPQRMKLKPFLPVIAHKYCDSDTAFFLCPVTHDSQVMYYFHAERIVKSQFPCLQPLLCIYPQKHSCHKKVPCFLTVRLSVDNC